MSVGSNLLGATFLATEVSEGSATGTGSGPYSFTESQLLANQKVFGTPIGPNATATVTNVQTAGGVTTVTVTLGNTVSFANNQQVSGTLLANDGTDFLLFGSIPGVGSTDLYVTNTAAQQPGVGGTTTVAGETPGVVYTPPCFCAGTMIQTPGGEVAVESLAIGSQVVTASGETVSVRWLGWRRIDLARHPSRATVQPIRIQAGAFGVSLPSRDLLVSPEHALFMDGALVPAGRLAGCLGIEADTALDHTTYYHVELDRHDILLANGVPCESWLDTGNRAMFENAGVAALHFDETAASAAWDNQACAPILTGGPALDAIRLRLGAPRPLELVVAAAGVHRFNLPAGVKEARLSSQPARVHGDARLLGAAVRALSLDGQPIDLADGRLGVGFHPAETGWRWTDGAGLLAVGLCDEPRVLVVEVSEVAALQRQAA